MKKTNKSIVQSISFHDELSIRNLINENGSGSKCLFKRVESIMTEGVELLGNFLLDEAYQ